MIEEGVKILDEDVASSIQSTFHIPDLSSIIQQLVENAIDADATSIIIQTKGKGFDEIMVRDDGTGIPKESRQLLCQLNYTSKLDLNQMRELHTAIIQVKTYGFRGEALHCICDIAEKVTILTRAAEDDIGEEMTFDSKGLLVYSTPKSCNVGTTVIVSKPFFRYPVRRKNLEEKLQQQFKDSIELVRKYAYICYKSRFQWLNEGSTSPIVIKQRSKTGLRGSIAQFLGKDAVDELHEVIFRTSTEMFPELEDSPNCKFFTEEDEEASMLGLGIHAFLMCEAPQSNSARNARGHLIYVNNRPVKHIATQKKINDYYLRNGIPKDAFAFVHYIINTDSVDVNTTDKSTVFFKLSDTVMDKFEKLLFRAIIQQKRRSINRNISQDNFTSLGGRFTSPTKLSRTDTSLQRTLHSYIDPNTEVTNVPISENNSTTSSLIRTPITPSRKRIPDSTSSTNSIGDHVSDLSTLPREFDVHSPRAQLQTNHLDQTSPVVQNLQNSPPKTIVTQSQDRLFDDIERWKRSDLREERYETRKRKREYESIDHRASPQPSEYNHSEEDVVRNGIQDSPIESSNSKITLHVNEVDIIKNVEIQACRAPKWYIKQNESQKKILDISQQHILDDQVKIIGSLNIPSDRKLVLVSFTPFDTEKHILVMDCVQSERLLMEDDMLNTWKMDKNIEEITPIPLASIKEFQDKVLYESVIDPRFEKILLWNGFKLAQLKTLPINSSSQECNNDNYCIVGKLQSSVIENFVPEVVLVDLSKKISFFKESILPTIHTLAKQLEKKGRYIDEQDLISSSLKFMRPTSISNYIKSKIVSYADKKMKDLNPIEAGEFILREMKEKQYAFGQLLEKKPNFFKLGKHFRCVSSFWIQESSNLSSNVEVKDE